MEAHHSDVTQVLLEAGHGDKAAADQLWAFLYRELRQIAHRELFGERRGHTLSTTALVHEAYLRFVDQTRTGWQDRSHFLALSCRAMRQILVDHARRRNTEKRSGRKHQVPLEEAVVMAQTRADELVALDEALTDLARCDPRLEQIVECRFFCGFSVEETAEMLGVSARTVARDWRRAQLYLYQALHEGEST